MQTLELIRDFVNTADLERGEDALADTRGLQYFLVFHGLAELRDRATAGDLAEARAIREALRREGQKGVQSPRTRPPHGPR